MAAFSLVGAYFDAAFAELYIYLRGRLLPSGADSPAGSGLVRPRRWRRRDPVRLS